MVEEVRISLAGSEILMDYNRARPLYAPTREREREREWERDRERERVRERALISGRVEDSGWNWPGPDPATRNTQIRRWILLLGFLTLRKIKNLASKFVHGHDKICKISDYDLAKAFGYID